MHDDGRTTSVARAATHGFEPTWVWGLPLSPLTTAGALAEMETHIRERTPSLYLSANLNFAMLCDRDPEMDPITLGAGMILADGMPVVWASKFTRRPVPERVAGSDLIFALGEIAAKKGYRVFLLGGAPGIGDKAARRLQELYGTIRFVGVEAPDFSNATADEDRALLQRIRESKADIMIVAASQPKGEKWLVTRLVAMGVPAVWQIGASLDFAAGKVDRAPRWIQKIGMEWAYRLSLEPKRLARRYRDNALFLLRMILVGPRRRVPAKRMAEAAI